MDSRNERHDGIEDEEGYLLVVEVVVRNGRDGQKSSPKSSPETKKQIGNGQTVMDSIKGIHYGIEDDEIYLVVVVVDARTRRFDRKSSPKSSPET